MTDPFGALRAPVVPTDPDPDFAATLRARLERALALPRGVTMTDIATGPAPLTESTAATRPAAGTGQAPAGTDRPATDLAARVGAAVPYLAVPAGQGRRALDWYVEALGATLVGEPVIMPDGVLGHAELDLAGGLLYVAEELPEHGVIAPPPAGTPVTLVLTVPDSTESLRRAMDRGATMPRGMSDDYGVRTATILDPFGHRWLLQTPLDRLPKSEQPGDVGHAWLSAPDPDRAAAFYAAVLGWTYTPGRVPGSRNVTGQSIPLGIGPGEPGFHLSYAVADVAAAVDRVRAAGGTATDPRRSPYGPAADGVDDQGVAFSLHRAGAAPRSPANGARPGDLSYLTLEVVDSARTRAFYGSVLGWSFEAGGMADGWAARGVAPMTGLHGGNAAYAAVPMWKVDDVPAAVERVRAAGGTATEPTRMPYGTTAECTDDQGLRFYLGDS